MQCLDCSLKDSIRFPVHERWWPVIAVIAMLLTCQRVYANFPFEDTPFKDNSLDTAEDAVPDDSWRGCECWRWPECSGNCTFNSILKTTLRAEHQLLATLALPFVLVFPYQDRKMGSKYGTSTTGKRGTYFSSTRFWIHMPNQQHVQLRIQKSRIFGHPGVYSTMYYQRNSEGQIYPFALNKLDHCFYTGAVRENLEHSDSDSYVAVDTCHGLRGLIHLSNQTFGVFPLQCATCQPDVLPHVVFPLVPTPIERDAKLPVFWQPTDVLAGKSRRSKKYEGQSYTIRLAIVVDHLLFTAFSRKLDQSIHYVGSIVNLATKSFQGLPVELKLVHSDIWNLADHIKLNSSIKTTLNHFVAYSTRQLRPHRTPSHPPLTSSANGSAHLTAGRLVGTWLRRVHRRAALNSPSSPPNLEVHDMHVLLTTSQFTDEVEYLAVPDSICTPRSLAVIQVNLSDTAYHSSRLLSLAVAEVLGLKSFPCPPRYSCSALNVLSDGDKARIRLALMSGMADCLLPLTAEEVAQLHEDTCGNGQLDRGEECDPANSVQLSTQSKSSVDANLANASMPCCNPRTCLADVGALCTHGACCFQCQLVPRGQLCRVAQDRCDLPEFCSGSEPNCPADLYLENGSPCRTRISSSRQPRAYQPQASDQPSVDETKALCYQGRCPTRESQCEAIWGPASSEAADYCFVLHNTRTAGACGVSGENCQTEHAMCGLLHCQGGEPRPVSKEAQFGQPFLTYTEHNGRQFECKHLSHASSVRFVPEGAACAENRYCFHRQCVSPHVALRSRCPSGPADKHNVHGRVTEINATCSDHGVCTNAGFCLCFPGWVGEACQLQSAVESTNHVSDVAVPVVPHSPLAGPAHTSSLDPVMIARIWSYVENMQRSDALGEAVRSGDHTGKEKRHTNSLYLATLLGAVVGGIFILLAIFLLVYRRRGHSRFPRKQSQTRCSFFSQRFHRNFSMDNNKGNGSARMHATCLDTVDLKYTVLSPTHVTTTDNDRRNRSYLSRWAHEPQSSADRSSRRRRETRHTTSPEYHHTRHRGDGRRRRKHCHLRRREDEGHMHSNRRSAKHSDASTGLECTQFAEHSGVNHSDTELAFRSQHENDNDSNSIDRMIKFGSMPSYKEDKAKHGKRFLNVTSSTSLNARTELPMTQPQLSLNSGAICFSRIECTSTTAPSSVGLESVPAGHNNVSSPPSVEITSNPISSLYLHPLSNFGTPELQINYTWNGTNAVHNVPGICSTAAAAAAAVENAKSGAITTITSKYCSPSSTLVMKDRAVEANESPMKVNDIPFSIVMENSWRQPEKGILKNKSEGCSVMSTNGGMTLGSDSTHKSSRRRHNRRRHRHHHRHRHHCKRCHSRSNLGDKDQKCDADCRVSGGSACLRCSYCTHADEDRRCRSVFGREKHFQYQEKRITANEIKSRTESEENINRSLSSSASSRDTGSLTSQSSSSSSFDALDANQGLTSSSTSSTTSTCSTALEVGPDGNVHRLGRNNVTEIVLFGKDSTRSRHEGDKLDHFNSREDHHGCRHRHAHHRSRRKRSQIQQRHRHNSAGETVPIAVTSNSVIVSESTGSSLIGNVNSVQNLSGASSSSSGLTASTGRHFHRRHRQLRVRRSTDEDGTTSGSHRSSPMPPVPTILCNAGQQTDEMGLLKTVEPTVSSKHDSKDPQCRELELSDGEWEEVECSESACEECQAANGVRKTLHHGVRTHLDQSSAVSNFTLTNGIFSSAIGPTVGHTNPAYVQSPRQDGETSMSNPSIICQQQSTASSSLSSSKNSRIGTPAMMYSPQPVFPSCPTNYSPRGSTLGVVGHSKVGVTNRAASSSSCSSSSMVSHSSTPFPRPLVSVLPGKSINSDEPTGQHSETEVDSHLHIQSGSPHAVGAFYPSKLISHNTTQYPKSQQSPMNVNCTTVHSVMPPAYIQRYPPVHLVRRDALNSRGADANVVSRSLALSHSSPTSRSCVAPTLDATPSTYRGPIDIGDNYYQHPYEEVATDDYAEATNGRTPQQPQHIYHQHGMLHDPCSLSSLSPNGCEYPKGDEDEDEQLSLDEGHPPVMQTTQPATNGMLGPSLSFGRCDVPARTTNYRHVHDLQGDHLSPWPNAIGAEAQKLDHRTVVETARLYHNPTHRQPIVSDHQSPVQMKPSTQIDADDAGSEFSISAFRRDDIPIPTHPLRCHTLTGHALHSVGQASVRHTGTSDLSTEGHSNDGTCDESDTSSLPEAGCDLVKLAQLDVSGRPSDALLSDLARQQQTRMNWHSNDIRHTNPEA